MPRISLQQAYDNRDVIAQIYKMLADVADSVAKATEAVAKALEAMETAEDAGEAAEAAQQTADGKQDALTTEQLAAVDSGITAAKVAEYDGYETLPDFSQAAEGDALVIGPNGPEWEKIISGYEYHETINYSTGFTTGKSTKTIPGFDSDYNYLIIPKTDTDNWCVFAQTSDIDENGSISVVISNTTPTNASTYIDFVVFRKPKDETTPSVIILQCANLNCYAVPRGGTSGMVLENRGNDLRWARIIPSYSASDAGKVLSVNSSGTLEWITLP